MDFMILPFSSTQLFGATYSRGLSVVIPQQAAELFSTGDETVTILTGSGDRHEDHMASALVRALLMIMDFILLEGMTESALSMKDRV
jgi:hypothetical protein